MSNWGGVVNTGRPLQVKYWGVATPAALTPTPPSQLTERRYPSDRWAQQLRRKHLFQRCRRVAHSRAVRVALSHSVVPIGAARYGALGLVLPRLPPIYLVLLRFGAMVISRVKYRQHLRATVIKITSINILLKKWKLHIDFCITVYIEALFCVIMCVTRVISMSFFCPSSRQILATPLVMPNSHRPPERAIKLFCPVGRCELSIMACVTCPQMVWRAIASRELQATGRTLNNAAKMNAVTGALGHVPIDLQQSNLSVYMTFFIRIKLCIGQ